MKKLVLLASIVGAVSFASASELWWTIGENSTYDDPASVGLAGWEVAKVYASADGANFGGTEIQSWTKTDIDDWGYAWTQLGEHYSANSFYIELCDSDGNRLGASYVSQEAPMQGATLATSLVGSIKPDGEMGMATPYAFTSFTTSEVVPEPTTGLLMLFGLAGLALRRRRA